MSTTQSASETQRHILSQATSLYSFVRDVSYTASSVLTHTPVIHSYVLSTLPEDPEHIELSEPGQPFRLSVSKPHFSRPPAPDPRFITWLVDPVPPYGDGSVQPTLLTSERALFEDFQDDPERVTAHRLWRRAYGKWHLDTERYRRVQKLFDALYDMLLTLRRNEDELELVLADGFVRLKTAPQTVYGPLVTHRLSLRHDVSINALILEDAHQGLKFSPVDVPSPHLSRGEYSPLFSERACSWARSAIHTPELAHWNDTALTDFFELLSRHMPQHVQFLRSAEDSPHSSRRDYTLYRKPQILLRKTTYTWDMRRAHAQTALQSIQRTASIQPALTTILTSSTLLETPQKESAHRSVLNPTAETLLSTMDSPLHLVETCPGSAQDQIISQMLVRLMAEGKRVLVTSARHTTLRALASQVPQPLQPLVASENLLPDPGTSPGTSPSSSSIAMPDSRGCILYIQKYAREHTLSELADTVQSLREKQTHLLDELEGHASSSADTAQQVILVQNTRVRVSDAQDFLRRHADRAGFFGGPVLPEARLPLSSRELHDLYAMNENLSSTDIADVHSSLPDPNILYSPVQMGEHCTHLQHAQALLTHAYQSHSWLPVIEKESSEPSLSVFSDDQIDTVRDFLSHTETLFATRWSFQCSQSRKDSHDYACWEELASLLHAGVAPYPASPETVPLVTEAHLDALSVLEDYCATHSSITRLTLLTHPALRAAHHVLSPFISTPELTPRTRVACAHLRQALEGHQRVQRIQNLSEELGIALDTESEAAERTAERIRMLLHWREESFLPLLTQLHLDSAQFAFLENDVQNALEEVLPTVCDVSEIRAVIDKETAFLAQNAALCRLAEENGSPTCAQLAEASQQADVQLYTSAYAQLASAYGKIDLVQRRDSYLARIRAVCPSWAEALEQRTGIHGAHNVPEHLQQAWTYAQYESALAALESTGVRTSTRTDSSAPPRPPSGQHAAVLRRELLSTRYALAVAATHYRTLQRFQQLGPNVSRTQAQSAIPAWIMPEDAVYTHSVLAADAAGTFDVLIIADAHLLDASALGLLAQAQTVVLFGDPHLVGVRDGLLARSDTLSDAVEHFRSEHLEGKVPFSASCSPRCSLYDVVASALGTDAHTRLTLSTRPAELLTYANTQVYHGQIHAASAPSAHAASAHTSSPQKKSARMVSYRVPDTAREENAVTALVHACMESGGYDGKTFGIVSLGDGAYTTRLRDALRTHFDPATYTDQQLLCGPAHMFQSQTRDVIILSCGQDARAVRRRSVRSSLALRELATATSSAAEQLWVVHACDPLRDLAFDDVRVPLFRMLSAHSSASPSDLTTSISARVTQMLKPRTSVRHEGQNSAGVSMKDIADSLGDMLL